jgi:DNA polymerase
LEKLSRSLVEALEYLRDLGYEDLSTRVLAEEMPGPSKTQGPKVPSDPPSPEVVERALALTVVGKEANGCTDCRLSKRRNNVVFGSGNPNADLLFIGEGPGAEEDRQGLPFVGPAGELLTKIIQAIGLDRDDVYIANVVKCRPPQNRDPKPDEAAACRGFLERQVALIQPRIIVALGRVAAQNLLDSSAPLGGLRGEWHSFEGVPVRATYHPAALLRNASWKRPTWEDMQIVRDRLSD